MENKVKEREDIQLDGNFFAHNAMRLSDCSLYLHNETLIIMAKDENASQRALYEESGKYLLGVSKLIFGGVILAGVMNLNVDKIVLFASGTLAVIITAIIVLCCLKKERSNYGIGYII